MRINYNVSAMLANNSLANNDNYLSKSLERLSSGLKINHAKDNPAGLAMAKRMNAQIVGLSTANQNASDGVSVIETADGALTEVGNMLQRMNELAVKASNGSMTDADRAIVQDEIKQLKQEVTRISESTEFNGQKLLNGEFNQKGYTNDLNVKVNSYSDKTPMIEYTIESLTVSKDDDGNLSLESFVPGPEFPENYSVEMTKGLITITDDEGFELTLDVTDADYSSGTMEASDVSVDILGIGAMRLQIGANEGQVLSIEIPAVNLRNMGIENTDVSTMEGAQVAIDEVSGAIKFLNGVRGQLGAYQNRLESSVDSLDITSENMTSAYSRIMDVDMAEEMTEYTTYQVLTQAGTSMLAQANDRPSQVLQLLQ